MDEGGISHSTCGSNDVKASPGRRLFRSSFVLLGAIGVVFVVGAIVAAVWTARTLNEENPPAWMTDQQALMDAIDHDNALAAQDLLKPRARGEFGPFLAVGPEDTSEPVSRERCDVQTSYGIGDGTLPLAEALSSPLAIPELSTEGLIAAACDGVVISVSGGWLMPTTFGGDEPANTSIFLIGYLPVCMEWWAAADRTELGQIDGYPALIEHPLPGQIMNSFSRVAYILFAEPKDERPGIIVTVAAPSLERAAEAVISSLEKRTAEMGLPPNPYN